MNIRVFPDSETASKAAATIISAQVLQKPDSVLGLATGGTPVETYQNLIKMYEEGVISFAKTTCFALDEYVGLAADHHQSYHYFLHENLFKHIDIPKHKCHVLNGAALDPEEECLDYEKLLAEAGGIDLQVLGIGRNAHIAFNECAEFFYSRTHVIDLMPETIEANSRFFDSIEEVPTRALTMGTGLIMESEKILLLAFGQDKAQAVQKMVHGQIHPDVQASILQVHPRLTVLLDRDAAFLL